MEHVGWKSHRMARHYLQLHKSLLPDSVAARMAQASPDTSSRYEELNQLQSFEPAFPPNLSCVTSPTLRKVTPKSEAWSMQSN